MNRSKMPQEHVVYVDMPFLCQAVCAKDLFRISYSKSGGFMDHKEKRIILKSYAGLPFSTFNVYFVLVRSPV